MIVFIRGLLQYLGRCAVCNEFTGFFTKPYLPFCKECEDEVIEKVYEERSRDLQIGSR